MTYSDVWLSLCFWRIRSCLCKYKNWVTQIIIAGGHFAQPQKMRPKCDNRISLNFELKKMGWAPLLKFWHVPPPPRRLSLHKEHQINKDLNHDEFQPHKIVDPSFTKSFGTHTFYQGGGRLDPPSHLKTVAPMNVKFCRVLETPLKVLVMSVVHIVFTWLP